MMYSYDEDLPSQHVAKFQSFLEINRCFNVLNVKQLTEFMSKLIYYYNNNGNLNLFKNTITNMFKGMVDVKSSNNRNYMSMNSLKDIKNLFPKYTINFTKFKKKRKNPMFLFF